MPVQTRTRGKRPPKAQPSRQKRVQSNASTTPPAQSRSPSLAHSAGAGEGSDYEEPENEDEDGDEENDGSGPDENSADEAVTQNALNARATHWQPWQDRILTQQVNVNRPFLLEDPQERAAAWDATADAVNAAVSKSATRPWTPRTGEACRKRLQRLMKNHKAGDARSLQKTGTNEEVDEFLLSEICALADGEVVATARKVKKKNDLEAQSGAEMRDASMKGLVKSAGLCDLASLQGATVRERQAQRGGKRKRDDTNENEGLSANAINKRRKKGIGALQDIVNTRLEEDKVALNTARQRDEARHDEQLNVLKDIAQGLKRVGDDLNSLRDEQERTNALLRTQELDRREEQIQRRERELQNVK
ncbi:hypothetical protein C8F04DRAFT_1274864 [Mycena alexandri]|uniref:Uncharacterized protein n=1 Tax=Mycena alexandri TaxID=1745969 RepID=A0AAD6S5C2_9AGAR|nr:hypothetical protein C8F04DRAFT_1274864 [Mycena alexandri]